MCGCAGGRRAQVVADLEEKGPQILRQREEWQAAAAAHAQAESRLEAALTEAEQLRHANRVLAAERRRRQAEAEALDRHNRDLSLQARPARTALLSLSPSHSPPSLLPRDSLFPSPQLPAASNTLVRSI